MKRIRSKYTHPEFQFARFRLASNDFGVDIKNVKEIIRHREIVQSADFPPFLEGFIRLRSMAVPVIDLRKRFSLEQSFNDSTRIIIASVQRHIAGLIVDEVMDITMGGKELMVEPGTLSGRWGGSIDAVIETGRGTVMIMNPVLLLTDTEKSSLDAPLKLPE